MSSTQFWVGLVVPPFLRWVNSYLKKFFKLSEFDHETKRGVFTKNYPFYFGFLYWFWVMALLSTGLTVLILFMIYGSVIFPNKSYALLIFLGLINMIGVWFIVGALLDFLFWKISSENFRDYITFRLIRSGWRYDMKQQIITLIKLGIIYYVVVSPLIAYLLIR